MISPDRPFDKLRCRSKGNFGEVHGINLAETGVFGTRQLIQVAGLGIINLFCNPSPFKRPGATTLVETDDFEHSISDQTDQILLRRAILRVEPRLAHLQRPHQFQPELLQNLLDFVIDIGHPKFMAAGPNSEF